MSDSAMAAAVRRLANIGGGIVAVDGAEVLAELPLPVAGPALGRAARRGRRAQPCDRLGRSRPRLHGRGAVPAALVPRALGDPEPEADRPRPRRRRPLRAGPPRGLVILANAWLVTMDDAGTRARARLGSDRGRAGRRRRRGRPARTGARIWAAPSSRRASSTLTTTSTRRSRAHVRRDADLFTWLQTLYPVWARIDDRDGVRRRAHAGSRNSRCRAARPFSTITTSSRAACPASSRPRFAPHRSSASGSARRAGRWTSANPTGGCRPTRSPRRSTRSSRTPSGSPGCTTETEVQIVVAPCSPFSVTTRLMEESAALARRLGLQLHTHLAETVEEAEYCQSTYGCTPGRVLRARRLAGRGRLVRALRASLAGRDRALRRARRGCRALPDVEPAAAARASRPCAQLLDAGVRVGLGVDGSASNERSDLFFEVKQAMLVARGRGGGTAMSAREALRLATRGGAAVLRRDDIGSLEPGKRADLAVWRDGRPGARRRRGSRRRPRALRAPPRRPPLVGGEKVVAGGSLVRARRRGDRTRAPQAGGEAWR